MTAGITACILDHFGLMCFAFRKGQAMALYQPYYNEQTTTDDNSYFKESSTTAAGYHCRHCGMWVMPGKYHACTEWSKPSAGQAVPLAAFGDARIAEALERIATALEKIANVDVEIDSA